MAFSKPHVEEPNAAANRSCVPIASYDDYTSAASSWISNLDAQGLLSKSIVTTTAVSTSFGYLGCMLGIPATHTVVSTVTSTPKYTRSRPPCATDTDGCERCLIIAETVQLFYWPVSTAADNPKAKFLVTARENITAVYNGITFTSPSVYLSYQNVWTSKKFCQNTGRNHSDALIKLDPSSLSSLNGYENCVFTDFSVVVYGVRASGERVNYANLNKPVSTSASIAERPSNMSGIANHCPKTDQNPILAVPEQIRSLDPNWKNCDIWIWGSHDPPHALIPVDALSGPISTVHPVVSSPAAASFLASPPAATGSTSTDTTSAFETPVTDPPSRISESNDPSVIDPASAQPAPKFIPTFDPDVLTRNVKSGLSTSSGTLSYIDPAMTSLNQVISMNAEGIIVDVTTVANTMLTVSESTTRIVAPIIFESMTFSASPSGYVIYGQTLHPGSGITISGTSIRLASSATALIVGTHTTALATAEVLPTLIIGSQTFTADLLSHYNINGQLLAPGGAITVSETPIPHTSSPTIVMNVHTILQSSATALSALTAAFQPLFPQSTDANSMGGQTLTTGGVTTVSGTPISLPSLPTALFVGNSTETFDPSLRAPVLGALIMSAFGNEGSIATTSNNTMVGNATYSGVRFAGGSERRCSVSWSALGWISLGSATCIVNMAI